MGRLRLGPNEFITREGYFAEYVARTLAEGVTDQRVKHVRYFGYGLLQSREAADAIVDEWLESRGT